MTDVDLVKENIQLKLQIENLSQDLIKLKEIQKELDESNQRFDDVIHSALDAILLIDGDKFVDANNATVKMLKYPSREDFLMSHPSKLSPPLQMDGKPSYEKAEEMMKMAYQNGFHRFEWIHRKADGEDFPVEVSLTPILYRGRTILHCLWRDLTNARKIEVENQKMQHEIRQKELSLIHASKMATLGEMAGGVAHEINNPLTIIIGYLKILKLELSKMMFGQKDRILSMITDIDKTAKRIGEITQGLYLFSRDATLDNLNQIPVNHLIHTTVSFCLEKFKNNNISLRIEDNSVDAYIYGNETLLGQALLNLLNNAYDAVKVQNPKWIDITTMINTQNSRIEIRIRDSGQGIPVENHHKIMQPFFTTKEVGTGTGLGLSISLGIVREHGGDLFLETDSCHTCFVISLPQGRPKTKNKVQADDGVGIIG